MIFKKVKSINRGKTKMNLSLENHYTNEEFLEYQYTVYFVKEWESEIFFKKEEKKGQACSLVINLDWLFRYQYLEIYALKFNLTLMVHNLNNKMYFFLSNQTEYKYNLAVFYNWIPKTIIILSCLYPILPFCFTYKILIIAT